MTDDDATSRRSGGRAALASGAMLLATFLAAARTVDGIETSFRIPVGAFSPSELWFWVAACAFALPGGTLLGLGFARQLGAAWSRFVQAWESATPRDRSMVVVVVGIVAACLARGGNQGVLLGQPFSEDEYGIRFGAHLLTHGRLSIAAPPWFALAPTDHLHARVFVLSSLDYPGAIALAALAEWTHLGGFLYAIAAGLCASALTALTLRRDGPRFGMLGAALALTSPSMALVSMSTDPHVLSRAFLALGLCAFVFHASVGRRHGALAGASLAIAISIRPLEILALTLPLLVGTLLDARRDPRARAIAQGLVLGALPVVIAVLAYDRASHGSVLFASLTDSDLVDRHRHLFRAARDPSRWGALFAPNLPVLLATLGVFVGGPLALPLAVLGRKVDVTHRRLFAGVALAIAVAVFRVAPSARPAGSLVLSDAAVPILLLATAGAKVLLARAEGIGADRRAMRGAIAGYVGIGLTIFVLVQSVALSRHAEVQTILDRRVQAQGARGPAVVLVPHYLVAFGSLPQGAWVGTWFQQWRTPLPDASERVIVLGDRQRRREDVRRWFPDRAIYVMVPGNRMGFDFVTLESLATHPRRSWEDLRTR